jgi:type IV secretory pathway ATPase VirB11/archaellum biosynthesis ATPase
MAMFCGDGGLLLLLLVSVTLDEDFRRARMQLLAEFHATPFSVTVPVLDYTMERNETM